MFQAEDRVTIVLDHAVALVVFDVLARSLEEQDGVPLREALDHPAEPQALWSLFNVLEDALPEPFEDDYARHVAAARQMVADRLGPTKS